MTEDIRNDIIGEIFDQFSYRAIPLFSYFCLILTPRSLLWLRPTSARLAPMQHRDKSQMKSTISLDMLVDFRGSIL